MSSLHEDEVVIEAKKVFRNLAADFLIKNVPEFDVSDSYKISNTHEDPLQVIQSIEMVDDSPSYLQPIFSPQNGEIVTYDERFFDEEKDEGTAHRSMSIRRAPNTKAFHSLRGSSDNVPFLPGGFNEEMEKNFRLSDWEEVKNRDEQEYLETSEFLDTMPGYSKAVLVSDTELKALRSTNGEDSKASNVDLPSKTAFTTSLVSADSADFLNENLFSESENTSTNIKNEEKGSRTIIKSNVTNELNNTSFASEKSAALELEVDKIEKTLSANVAPKTGPSRVMKRREFQCETEFLYAQMIDVTKPAPTYEDLKPSLAKTFPFELDPFQQHAVVSMEEGTSVFIAAHTSAGKTVVAEYAIALCKIHKTRVIYTSPIKALSNQKFRDFKLTFEDVGLVTGDIQLNTDAFCLIMTTEILRSMIYNGSEAIRELEWVIFDEVHYINDEERGYVWEEIFIMLPSHVKIVMLSATVPNCMEFADWVGRIKNRKISVIQTLKRPVPLEHYLYTGKDGKTKKDIFLIMNKDGEFLPYNYKKAVEAKKNGMAKNSGPDRRQYAHANDRNIYINLIDYLKGIDLLPMVAFVFSRKRCDQAASLLQSVDLTTAKEKSEIHKFFSKCIDRLKGSDRRLPQLLLMQEHCKRGFAVHHSGILPIIKEVVELLFQRGYVKILFATETFAMGVNMPARTVVFDTIEKFDGNARRFLNSTEYVQMAGRAGRRGLDSTGTVIIITKGPEPPDLLCLTNMLLGKPIHLESRFRITYGMILNLLRVEQLRIEDMLQRSFVERNSLRLMSSRKEQMLELAEAIKKLPTIECHICIPSPSSFTMPEINTSSLAMSTPLIKTEDELDGTSSIMNYYQTLSGYSATISTLWLDLVMKCGVDKLFNPGRVIIINHAPLDLFGRVAIVLEARRIDDEGKFLMTLLIAADKDFVSSAPDKIKTFHRLTIEERKWHIQSGLLAHMAEHGVEGVEAPTIGGSASSLLFDRFSYYILEHVGVESLSAICKQNVKVYNTEAIIREFRGQRRVNRDISPTNLIRNAVTQINNLATNWSNAPAPSTLADVVDAPNAKPIYLLGKDIMKNEIHIHRRICEVREVREQLMDQDRFPCLMCPYFGEHFKKLLKRVGLEEKRRLLVFQTSSDALLMSRDYADRLGVLKSLEYIDKNNMTGLKGKVACEINHQELLITELMLENKFEGLLCPEVAALLSPLTCKVAVATKSTAPPTPLRDLSMKSNIKVVSAPDQPLVQINSHNAVNKNIPNGTSDINHNPKELQLINNHHENGNVKKECDGDSERVQRAPADVIERLKVSLIEVATRIDSVQERCGIHTYVTNELNYGLMETVYQWASGMPFSDIVKLTDAQEGIIVRCIQRLDEVLKDVRKAARIVGNPDLYERMEETSAAIKRDIVFAASLYTVEE